jgi:signal transduction histidine kinase
MTPRAQLIHIPLAIALLLVMVVAALAYNNWLRFGRENAQLSETRRLSQEIHNLRSALVDAETGQRGFLLTGRESYLEPYQKGVAHMSAALSDLASAAAAFPDQAVRVEALQSLVQAKLDEMQKTIELRRSQGSSAAVAEIMSDRGKVLMDQIRQLWNEIDGATYDVLSQHRDEMRASANRLGLISTFGGIALLLLLVGSSVIIYRETQARQKLIAELRRINEDLNHFAFAASHDLQEPLRMITAYSQLLVKHAGDKLDEEAPLWVHFITEGSQRIRALLADLLAYTQVSEDGNQAAQFVDLNQVLQRAIENLHIVIKENEAVIGSDHLPLVSGHEAHLLQLFQNLIGNSIKYRGEDAPRIHLSAEQQDGAWRVAVTDNGIGIPREYHDKVFGVFKRLHGKTLPGSGIGLAICKRVVERHGGRIWVESQVDRGATFYFTLPAVTGERP